MDFLTDEERATLKEHDNAISNEVLVRNIDFRVTADELRAFCVTNFGPVEQYVIKTHSTGQLRGKSKGYGNVLFTSLVAANNMAVASIHGQLFFRNRKLIVHSLPRRDAELYYSQQTKVFGLASFRMGSWESKNHFVFVNEADLNQTLTCHFLVAKRKIELMHGEYKLILSFKDLSDKLVLEKWGEKIVAYLSLKRPPKIYGKEPNAHTDLLWQLLAAVRVEEKEEERICDFTPGQVMKFCSVYQLIFNCNTTYLENVLLDLARFNLTDEPLKFIYPYTQVTCLTVRQDLEHHLSVLPFNIRFKVESLIYSWKIMDPRIHGTNIEFQRFINFLLENTENNVLEGALDLMSYVENPIIFDLVGTLQTYMQISRPLKVNKDFMPVARLLITPTKVHLVGPEMEVSNRVLRQYSKYTSHFVRISFVDENLCQLLGTQFKDRIGQRFKKVFTEGIKVAGRTFQFLAYSASQLREHGCWFFAPVDGITPDSIRAWMGDFSTRNNVVAKYAARMGQCFSTTFEASEIPRLDIKHIPDITTIDQTYTFSDGIGMISFKYAEEVAAKLSLKRVPSAYQCRIGGCKGMVAVSPNARHKLYVRPSMEKFDSEHTVFEVIGTSHFIPSYLNRQIVALLSNLGIPDQAFENLQDEMVKQLDEMLVNDNAAKQLLKAMPDYHDFSSTALKMLKGGFSVQREPFLNRLLTSMYGKKMRDLKLKTRILLKDGACLIGTLDETKSLKYGQVFLKIHRPGSKTPQVITGRVFVVKNPAFHPGDIRVLEAVDSPNLHHMIDCLVFPANGPRPHTSETSGSDLDGDIYTVCWDKTLVPAYHVPPGMYEAPKPLTKSTRIEMSDIHDFFIDYMKNDILGVIANTHLAIADASAQGPSDPKCLRLTELHSLAVDYPKTGIAAKLPHDLRVNPQVGYPDFMEKKGKSQYKSQKILGILYRKIQPTCLPPVPLSFDSDLLVEGHEEFLEQAMNAKKDYNFRVITLMNQFGVKTEAELISGCVTKIGRQFLKKKFFDHIQRMCQAVYAMKKEIRAQFEEELENIPIGDRDHFRKAKASAWYKVAYAEEYRVKEQGTRAKELLGFPWIMVDLLVKIKKEKEEERRVREAARARSRRGRA